MFPSRTISSGICNMPCLTTLRCPQDVYNEMMLSFFGSRLAMNSKPFTVRISVPNSYLIDIKQCLCSLVSIIPPLMLPGFQIELLRSRKQVDITLKFWRTHRLLVYEINQHRFQNLCCNLVNWHVSCSAIVTL